MAESKYSQILAKNRIYEAERKQKILQNQQPMQEQVKEDDPGFWESVGATLADVITEPVGGLLKGVEGVIDAGVGFVGGIGDLFGADTEWAEDIVKFDATQNWYYDAFEDKLTEASAVNKAPIVKEIVRGVGQQLPAIALNFIPGVGPALSMTYLGLSAVGGGTEEGLSEDAEMGEAFMYGLAQGGIEFLTEKVTAGLGKGIYSVGKSSAKGIGKVMLEESVSEGIEEGLSALVNPLSKTIYKGADALNSYGDLTFYLDSAQQALVGAAVGGIIGGSSAGIQQRIAGGKQNFMIEQSVKEISALETKENNLWKNKKLDSKQIEKIETQRQAELENIGKQLQNMDEETRKSTIEKYNLSNMFNKDGSIVVESAQEFNGQEIPNINRKPLTTDNMEAYSPNVRNQTLLYAPTSKALSETAINAKDFITTLNSNAKLVISDSMPQNVNAFYDVDSKTFYLSNSATVDTIAGHEFTHSLEGTKEYKKLADYILANTEGLETKIQQKIEQYSEVNKESKSGENGKQVALYEAQTEIVAEEMGKLLSDPKAIERIVNRNKSGAHRIIQWIKDVIAKLTKKGKTGEYYNYLRNAEKLYAKAIKTSIGGVSLSDISAFEEFEKLAQEQSENLELENTDMIDNLTGVRYSKKRNNLWDKLTKQDQALLYKAVGEINNQNYYEYQLENGDYVIDINNKIVISNGDYLKPSIESVVEFSKFSNKISEARDYFYEQIINGRTIRESVEYINTMCEEQVATLYGYEDSELNSKSTEQRRYNLKNREDSQREERTRGPKTTRYSLSKDSQGNALSENQEKFFKDSKIRDENGNLLVVYHGSKNEFNVFDISKSGESSKQAKVGFWFTENKQGASNFANDIWYGKSDKEIIYSVYLNIKNPKIYESYEIDRNRISQLRDNIKVLENNIQEINSKYSWQKTNYRTSMLFSSIKQELSRGLTKLDKEHFKLHAKGINASEIFNKMWQDAEKIILLEKKQQDAENDYYKYKASDAYEQFRTDLYLSAGMRAEDANVGGIGMAMHDSDKEVLKFVNSLKEQGYDGIIIKNTEYDKETIGEGDNNNQYVAFEPNQIKRIENKNPTIHADMRYSLKNSVEEDVLKTFGKTYDWKETGYILKDGTKLDLSGKHEGAAGGRRSVDHREIFDIYEDSDVYGTDAMVEFMGRGNIRVSPEYPGVNIQVEPTQEQYEQIQSMVERLGWKEKAFIVDIDNHLGETIETMEYEGAVSGRKVVADIKYYFKEGKLPYKSRLTDFRYSLVDGQFGKGYSVKDINIDEYNLVNIKDNENLALFTRLLGQVENVIKNNQANGNTVLLRQNLFKVLSQQENNVYSKLIEINKALNKTQTEYNTNKNINVVQTFIQELGYNGVFVKENNSLGLESVIYNIDKKKRNLLDFSPERAKERLDKAIKLFGETDNPAKAGWLLSDGRFVDYNRDSANILKETSDDFVLDYRDHFQIEKVYDTKRGYDAIDSFMAEGNIRLMPEVGGIELRNKPKATQLDSLTQYIDTLIDKNGITLDLRKPNTSENVLTNYVYYTTDFDSKTIIKDINSFYNNGQMPRVIDGARYSLRQEDIESLPGELKDGIIKELNKENISLGELYEYGNGERRISEGMGRTRGSGIRDNQTTEREIVRSRSKILEAITSEYELNGNKEAVKFVEDIIKNNKLYYEFLSEDLVHNSEKYSKNFKIVHKEALPKQLQEIMKENTELGLVTGFYVAENTEGQYYRNGIFVPSISGKNKIMILLDESNSYFVNTNRHERTHYYQRVIPNLYSDFKKDIDKIIDEDYLGGLYDKYNEQYREEYTSLDSTQRKQAIWNEVYAQIYALNELTDNEKVYDIVEKFDDKVKEHFKLSHDLRYSLKDGNSKYDFSKGQIAKYVAEHSRLKAYTKGEAESVINTVVESQLSFGSKYGEISGKTKEQAANTLWHTFNTKDEGFRSENILDIADFIINNAVMEDIYQNDTYEYDNFIVGELKDYLHKIDLSAIKGEIKHHYDTDNSPYLIWGKRSGVKGLSPDQIAQELESRGIKIDAQTEADIFFELDSMYRNSLKNLKKAVKQRLTEIASKEELEELRQNIARELLNSFDENGHKTKFAETLEKYTGKIKNLKQAIKDIKEYNKAKNNLVSTIERLKDEFTKSKPAGWKVPQQVVDFVKTLSKIETWRNNITKTAREYLVKLQSKIDLVMDDTQKSIYPYREVIAEIASGEGELTTQELAMLDNIFRQFAWQLRNYDNVEFEGKVQSNTDLSAQGVKESKQAKPYIKDGKKLGSRFKHHVYSNPYDRLAEIGLYREHSIMVRIYKDMLNGDRRRAGLLRDVSDLFSDFFKNNKNYLKELRQEIKIGDVSISKRQAITIYCTSLREQGRSHLFNLTQDSGVIHLLDNKLSVKGKMREAFSKGQDIEITSDMIHDIKNSLTDADKEYLKLVDTFFNKISKDAKKITDEKLYGITNIEEGYYFPIKVSSDKLYHQSGQSDENINQYILEMGMNKSTKPNANNKIVIDGIESIVANHLHNLSLYYGYAIPLTAYNRIMNKQVDTLDGSIDIKSNMMAEIQKIDPYFKDYMDKLWRDIQGISAKKDFFGDVMSYIRWATANSVLGLNLKVLVTQTLSLASATAEFNHKYVVKGLGHFFGEKEKLELSKYSPLMWERMQIGNSIDIAEIREMSKNKVTRTINDITTKPISWMDSNVIQSLWFAAQYEVADTKGLEFGSEANKIEAGKRLDEVVFRTQQTSDPLGRSEWMRSQNELVKFVRMFTGDAIQLTGRLIASVDKHDMAKEMIKSDDVEIRESGQKLLKIAKIDLPKSGSAFVLNQAMLLAIAMAFKWLKGKNDDEEWSDIAKNELTANLMGLIPFGGDIYDKISGYEPTNMAYTALSNTVDVVTDLMSGISTMIKGDYESEVKRNATFRKSLISISRLLGIPLQNLESYTKGIVGHVSPKTREEYEALFKTKSNKAYLDQIKKATENGDEDLAESIINIMFDSRTGKIKDDRVLDTTRELIEQGYDVIPKSVGKTITYDGVEYILTDKQHKQFTKIYSQANDTIKRMINLSTFTRMDDEAKAKAMNFIYNYYYNLAIEDMLGEDLESKNLLFAEAVPIEQLAMAVSQAQVYTSDVAKDGKVISGTKKAKVQSFVQSMGLTAIQKYMIMGYLGYSNKFGATLVKTYINRLSLSKTQKQYLYEMSGYGI